MQARDYPATRPSHVYLFGTCVIDLFMPQAGLDAVRLLEREGVTVHYPRGQSCCGQPAYSSVNPVQARAVALAQMALFPNDWPVIVPSGSCAGMMRHHWPDLFEDDPVNQQKRVTVRQQRHDVINVSGRLRERWCLFLFFHIHAVDYKSARAAAARFAALSRQSLYLCTACSVRIRSYRFGSLASP
jgi:hypothetical protein